MKSTIPSAIAMALLLAACAAPTPREPTKGTSPPRPCAPHRRRHPGAGPADPGPAQAPRPAQGGNLQRGGGTMSRSRICFFVLARDAKLNVDIHEGISGNVTLNAIDQTLPQLLSRIAKQVDMRFELDGPNLVMPDPPSSALQSRLRTWRAPSRRRFRRTARSPPSDAHRRGQPRSKRQYLEYAYRKCLKKTSSGSSWKRTSRTSCGKPTKSFLRVERNGDRTIGQSECDGRRRTAPRHRPAGRPGGRQRARRQPSLASTSQGLGTTNGAPQHHSRSGLGHRQRRKRHRHGARYRTSTRAHPGVHRPRGPVRSGGK